MVASVHDKRPVLGVWSTPFPVPAAGGTPAPVTDRVPSDSYGSIEIGFDVPERYNASDILFQNLARGHGDRRRGAHLIAAREHCIVGS